MGAIIGVLNLISEGKYMYKIVNFDDVIKELKERGHKVDTNDVVAIPTENWLKSIESHAVSIEKFKENVREYYLEWEDDEDMPELDEMDAFDFMELMEEIGLWTEETTDNTYNWNAPLTHHVNFHVYTGEDDSYWVLAKVHLSGDIRSNYTDYVLFQFDSVYGIEDEFHLYTEQFDRYLDIDGEQVDCVVSIDVSRDYARVWIDDMNIDEEMVLPYDFDEMDEQLEKIIREYKE